MRILHRSRLLRVALAAVFLAQFAQGAALAQGQYVTYRSLGMLPVGYGGAYRFAVASDSHVGYGPANEKTAAALSDMSRRYPDLAFMVHMGDLTETGAAEEYRLVKEMTDSLPFPVIATAGNHESKWQDPQSSLLRTHFGAPNTSFNCGAWHFVVLDTSYPGETLGTLDPATLSWLEADLRSNPGRPVAVFSHHPLLYPERDFQDSDDAFARVMDTYPVRAVFSGHGHSFLTWKAQGQRFQMVGALMDSAYALVTVDGTSMTVSAVQPDPSGSMVETRLWQATGMSVAAGTSAPQGRNASGNPLSSVEASEDGGVLSASFALASPAEVSFRIDSGYYNRVGRLEAGVHEITCDVAGHAKGTHTFRLRAETGLGPYFASAEFGKDASDLVVWEKDLGSAVVGSILPADQSSIIVGTRDGWVRSIGTADGRIAWEHNAGSQWGGGCVDGDRLYLSTAAGTLQCLDVRDGSLSWTLDLDATGFFSAPLIVPTPSGKLLVAGSNGGRVYAVSAFHGGQAWTFQAGGAIHSSPVHSAGKLFFGAWDGHLYAICSSEGSLAWSVALGRQVYYSPYLGPAVSGNMLFATVPYDAQAGGSLLYALDVSTGDIMWKQACGSSLTAPSAPSGSPVTVCDASGTVRGFSPHDGSLLWSLPGSATLFTRPPGKGAFHVTGGYRGVVSFLTPQTRADYAARHSFLFVSPVLVGTSTGPAPTGAVVADTRGRISLLAFPR